ncbi:gp58-like family protein [bacterium]|nr:gp58-like family protein [bacterium]
MDKTILVLADGTELCGGGPGDAVVRLTHRSAVNSGQDLTIGSACSDSIEAELWCEPGGSLRITEGDTITCYRQATSGARTKIGVFRAEKPTRTKRSTYKITAYDGMSRLDADFSAWLYAHQSSFPLSLTAVVNQALALAGVSLSSGAALPDNGSYPVQAFYADGLTCRQIVSWAAEAAACYAHMDADGKLVFARPTSGSTAIAPQKETGAVGYFSDSLSYEDYTVATIQKVQIRQSDSDVGVIWPDDAAALNTYAVQGNLLLTTGTEDSLKPVAQAIYNALKDITYTPCSAEIPACSGIAPGQLVQVRDVRGRTFQTLIMSAVTTGGRTTLESTGSPRRDSSGAVNHQTWKNLQGRMLEISAGVDGLSVKASELSGNYSELSQTVEGFKTEVQNTVSSQNERISTAESNYSSLSQTVSSLSSTVSSVKTTANNAASKADSAAAKADSALSDAKNYTDGQLETVKGELSAEIEQTPSRIQLSVERSGYFSVFEGTSWTNHTDGTFGNKITVNGVSGTAARLSTTDPDTLTYARGNTLHGSLSYRILTAIKGTSSSASFRFFLGVKYTDDTYTINDIIYDQGNKTIAAAGSKTTVSLDVSVSDKEISLIYLEVSASSCSGVIEVGEVWANVAELNGKASTLTLTADGTKISSANIVMRGAVSFEDLSGTGRTTINGANVNTGIVSNAAGTTEYNLDNGTIRMGGSSGNRVCIDSDKIEWYGGNAIGGGAGLGTIRNGLTTGTAGDTCVIGADTRYQKYGWYHDGNFQGITVEQVDNEVSVSGKLSVNQEVSCRTLKAWDAKERVVRTPLGNLQMNAMESPEPLFWDVGSGVCDSTGVCWIALRPEYAETISRRAALRWVVTPTGGPGSLWVEKLDSGALVHGGAGQRFDWMCAGVQRGFEGCYAEGDPGRYPVPENPGDWLLTAAIDEAAVDLPLTV